MKGTMGPNIFVHRAEHILTHLQIVQGNLYPQEFSDTKSVSYSNYIRGALDRNLDFKIDEELFSTKIKESCYLCGKDKTETHKNGLDRFDNSIGYTEENIRTCCFNCNYMKKDYEYDNWINKLRMICDYQTVSPIKESENKELNPIVKSNKMSAEERKEFQIINKQNKLTELRESYINEDKRQERIENILKKRLQKS
jgi:hypothetical protein